MAKYYDDEEKKKKSKYEELTGYSSSETSSKTSAYDRIVNGVDENSKSRNLINQRHGGTVKGENYRSANLINQRHGNSTNPYDMALGMASSNNGTLTNNYKYAGIGTNNANNLIAEYTQRNRDFLNQNRIASQTAIDSVLNKPSTTSEYNPNASNLVTDYLNKEKESTAPVENPSNNVALYLNQRNNVPEFDRTNYGQEIADIKESQKIDYYNNVVNNDDFEEKSRWNQNYSNDNTYRDVNNSSGLNEGINKYEFLTEAERSTYNYLYATDGKEAAEDYLGRVNMSQRMTESANADISAYADSHPFLSTLTAGAYNVLGGVGYAEDLYNNLTGKEVDPYSLAHLFSNQANAITQTNVGNIQNQENTPEWLKNTEAFLYQTGLSTEQFLMTSAAVGFNPTATMLLMGSNAATSTVIDAKNRGLDDNKAVVLGLASGLAEAITEKYSLETLLKTDSVGIKAILSNMVAEGSEEMASDVLNFIADDIISGDLSDYNQSINDYMNNGKSYEEAKKLATFDFLQTVITDGLAGAISGGAIGGGASAINTFENYQTGKKINNTAPFTEVGLQSDVKETKALAQKVSEGNAKKSEVGRLVNTVMGENNINSSIYNNFIEEGYSEKESRKMTEAVIDYISGKELTKSQRSYLEDETFNKVVSGVTSGELDSRYSNYQKVTNAYEEALNMAKGKTVTTNTENATESTQNSPTLSQRAIQGALYSEYQTQVRENQKEVAKNSVKVRQNDIQSVNVSDNGAEITLKNGQTVTSDYIANPNMRSIVNQANNYIGDSIGAESFIKNYNDNVSVPTYTMAALQMINAGKKGTSIQTAIDNASKGIQYELSKGYISVGFLNDMYAYGQREQSNIYATNKSATQMEATQLLANAIGINYELLETDIDAQGAYNEKTNRIEFGKETGRSRIEVLAHEVVHAMKVNASETYNQLKDTIIESFNKQGTYEKFADYIKELYNTDNIDLVNEEMVARAMEEMLFNENVINDICENNKPLAQKILDFIRKALTELRNTFNNRIGTKESDALKNDIEALEKAEKLYVKGLKQTFSTKDIAKLAEGKDVTIKNDNGDVLAESYDGEVMYSQATWEQGGKDTLIAYLDKMQKLEDKSKRISKKTANAIIEQMDEIYRISKDMDGQYASYSAWANAEVKINEAGSPVFSCVVNNGEYKLNIDFSTVCKKRKGLDSVLNTLVRKNVKGVTQLNEVGMAKLTDLIKSKGLEVACRLCFVDSKRFRINAWANSFCDMWNSLVNSLSTDGQLISEFNYADAEGRMTEDNLNEELTKKQIANLNLAASKIKSDEDTKPIVKSMVNLIISDPSYRHILNAGDLISSAGMDSMKQNGSKLYDITNRHQGTAKPKTSHSETQFINHIINGNNFTPEKAFAVGGVRIQSFSDYMANMFFDYAQLVSELSAKGLPAHSYTKEMDYVRIFGLTGIKINMSLVPRVWQMSPEMDKFVNEYLRNSKGVVKLRIVNENEKGKLKKFTYEDGEGETHEIIFKGSVASKIQEEAMFKEFMEALEHVGLEKDANGIWTYAWSDETFKGYDKDMMAYYKKKGNNNPSSLDMADYWQTQEGYTKNVGTISIGVSNAQIEMMLNDPRIRMIIPYHKSGINHTVARMGNIDLYKDYTYCQNTRYRTKDGKVKKLESDMPDFNWYEYINAKNKNGSRKYTAKQVADMYLEFCDSQDVEYVPKFDEFRNNPNYYKLLEDFASYDMDGKYSPQEAVQMVFPEETKLRQYISESLKQNMKDESLRDDSMDDLVKGAEEILSDESNLNRDRLENLKEEKKATKDKKKYSLKDSDGNALTENQIEFFKDSKIRDENGNLKVMYHGTKESFTVFDPFKSGGVNGIAEGYGLYFSDNKEVSDAYGNNVLKGYLNVTKPASKYKKTIKTNSLVKLIKATCIKEAQGFVDEGSYDNINDAIKDTWISNYVYTYDMSMDKAYSEVAKNIIDMSDNDFDIIQEVMSGLAIRNYKNAYEFYDLLTKTLGFDGFETEWTDSNTGEKSGIVLAINSNQFKNIDNENPTDNEDIRYSIKDDIVPSLLYNADKYGITNPQDNYTLWKKIWKDSYEKRKGFVKFRNSFWAYKTSNIENADYEITETFNSVKDVLDYIEKEKLYEKPAYDKSEDVNRSFGEIEISKRESRGDALDAYYGRDDRSVMRMGETESSRVDSGLESSFDRSSSRNRNRKINSKKIAEDYNTLVDDYLNGGNVKEGWLDYLVAQYAESKGYKYKAFHGTTEDFFVFDIDKAYKATARYINGSFHSVDENVSKVFSKVNEKIHGGKAKVIKTYLKMEKPLVISGDNFIKTGLDEKFKTEILNKIKEGNYDSLIITPRSYQDNKFSRLGVELAAKGIIDPISMNSWAETKTWAEENGYSNDEARLIHSGIMNADLSHVQYAVFSPNQIKSADPITYYDNGKVVPLNKRFDGRSKNIRKSIKDTLEWDESYLDNETIKDSSKNAANILKEGFDILKKEGKFGITHKQAKTLAEKYLDKYNSKQGVDKTAKQIESIFTYISKNDVSYDDMLRVMRDFARPLVENTSGSEEWVAKYKPVVDYLKKTPIYINEEQKRAIEYAFGSWTAFRRQYGNVLNIVDDPRRATENKWTDIVDAIPELLSEDMDASIMPIALTDAIDHMRDKTVNNEYLANADELAHDIALNIYTDYFGFINDTKLEKVRAELKDNVRKYEDALDKMYKEMLHNAKSEAQSEIDRLTAEYNMLKADMDLRASIETDYQIQALRARIQKLKETKAEELAYRKSQRLKAAEKRANSKTRNRIKSIVKDLTSRLSNPTENHNVPSELVKATIEMLEAINLDTKEGDKLADKVAKVKDAYERMKTSGVEKGETNVDFDESLYKMITYLKDVFNGKSLRQLTTEELNKVIEIAQAIQIQVRNSNHLINSEEKKNIYELGSNIISDVRDNKYIAKNKIASLANGYINTSLNAERYFRRLVNYKDDSSMLKLYNDLNEGAHKQIHILREVNDIFKDVLEGNENQKMVRWMNGENLNDWVDTGWKDKNGKPIKVPASFRVSLAMHMQNEDNMKHIIYGGLTLPDPKLYHSGERAEAYSRPQSIVKFVNKADLRELYDRIQNPDLTVEEREQLQKEYKNKMDEMYNNAVMQIKNFVDGMTDYEKEFLKASEKYFHEYSGQKINETSMELNGYLKAQEKNYFPIESNKAFVKRENEGVKFDSSIDSNGHLKARVHGSNPIVLNGITDVINWHSDFVSKYAGLAIPIRNFNKVYNVSLGGYEDSVKNAIGDQRGQSATKYIDNLMADLQGGRHSNTGEFGKFANKLRGNFASAVLTMSPSVTIKQAASFPTAAAELGWDAMMHTMLSKDGAMLSATLATPMWQKKSTKEKMEIIGKYTDLVWYRNQGNSTQELGDLKNMQTLMDKTRATKAFKDFMTNWIQNVDTATVVSLWEASEYRVSKYTNLEKGSEEYFNEVAKVFNNAVERTQPNYTTLQRPDILRNPNELLKNVLMFKTQPLQNLGILYDSTNNYIAKSNEYKATHTAESKAKMEEARNTFINAVTSQVVSAAVFSAMTLLANALLHRMDRYRDEDKELTLEALTERYFNDFLSTFAGMLPMGSELYDFVQSKVSGNTYYGLEVSTVELVNDLAKDMGNLYDAINKNDSTKVKKNLEKVAFDSCSIFGIPVTNAKKIVKAAMLHIEDAKNDQFGSFEAGVERSEAIEYHRMLGTYTSGDMEKFNEVMSGVDVSDGNIYDGSHAGKPLKKLYLSGDITGEFAEEYLVALGMDANDAHFKVMEWETGSSSKYIDVSNAIASKDYTAFKEALNELESYGIEEDNIKSEVMGYLKESFLDKRLSESEALKYLTTLGYDRNSSHFKIQEWETGSSSPYYNVYEAISSGNINRIENEVNEMKRYGYDNEKLAKTTGISSHFKEEYINLYNTNRTKAAELKSAILTYYQLCGKSREDASKQIDKWVE